MKCRSKIILPVFFLIASSHCFSQQKYWITFADKSGTTFNPHEYFDARTIQQRNTQCLPLYDSTDFPVNENYLACVGSIADSLTHSSRWLNGVAAYASKEEVEKIKELPCVTSVEIMSGSSEAAVEKEEQLFGFTRNELALLKFQTQRMRGDLFRNIKLDGTGIRIAMFDAGFPGVNQNPAFEHIRKNKKIVATHDFVKNTDDVYAHNAHGAMTLSCISGKADSINSGLATGAEFLLARTEMAVRETFSEEENWLAAVEWADRHGANIVSSSIGYTEKRYFNTEMDGKKSLVARAANIAASKGILVVNAAGNEGNSSWRFIDTPGDADSVLTVGGTDPYTDAHIYFSSFGPTSDGRMKPNVCCLGHVMAANAYGWSEVEGTSFAAPLVAGFAACVWQLHRDWSNMQVFHEIEKSSHLYPYFDYAHGYGIPQATYFTEGAKPAEPTFDFVIVNNDLKIILREKYSYADAEDFLGYNTRRNLFIRVDDEKGIVQSYVVILAEEKEVAHYFINQFLPGDKITVHFEGYTYSYTVTGNENPPGEIK